MDKNVIYYGSSEPLSVKTKLKAGKLSMVYEKGFLRYIGLGKHEL